MEATKCTRLSAFRIIDFDTNDSDKPITLES
jgi:hypothetical protein